MGHGRGNSVAQRFEVLLAIFFSGLETAREIFPSCQGLPAAVLKKIDICGLLTPM